MDKIQINIPSPMLIKLKAVARRWDKGVSEVIRSAIERMLAQVPGDLQVDANAKSAFRTFDLGEIQVSSEKMREILSER